MGRLCYPTTAPGRVPVLQPESCHGARRVWRTFCRPGTNFYEHYACRGTSLVGAANLSPDTNLVAGTGAVSRYNLSRSQKFVKVQDLYCGQMRVSGCNGNYKFVLGAGAKAKSVTNNLHILSVLGVGKFFVRSYRTILLPQSMGQSSVVRKALLQQFDCSLACWSCKSAFLLYKFFV